MTTVHATTATQKTVRAAGAAAGCSALVAAHSTAARTRLVCTPAAL